MYHGLTNKGSIPELAGRSSQLSGFTGAPDTLRAMVEAAQGLRGEKSMVVRNLVDEIVKDIHPKDYAGEIVAIRNWAATYLRYTNDPLHVELIKDPQRLVEEFYQRGVAIADCFPSGTLMLNDRFEFVPVESLAVGDRIFGHEDWSIIEGVIFKGQLEVDAIQLNNGSTMLLTPEHHVYRMVCPNHGHWKSKKPCSCPVEDRVEERVRVSELSENDVLATPKRLPFGAEEMNPERAYLEGLFLSDGWVQNNSSFSISGQDGCPKEKQKQEVESICERLGLRTTMYRKSINIQDREWTQRLAQMGRHAPEKHLLSLNLGEGFAGAVLRGIMADSGAFTHGHGRCLTTTSRQLALQVRVLQKMFGRTCYRSYIEKHGGLGEHPIYRLSVRGGDRINREKLLRVKHIERGVAEVPVWDIQTNDHRVYLPEHDVTVSQCDEIACLIATGCLQVGRHCQFVAVGFGEPGTYSHVFTRVMEPRTNTWVVCDPVAGTDERKMLNRVATYQIWSLDELPSHGPVEER